MESYFYISGDVDYVEIDAVVTFDSASSNISCLTVTIQEDNIVESNETFLLELFANDSAVMFPSTSASVLIVDDDGE